MVVINETMARTIWPGEDAVGKILRDICNAPERRVVGVVAGIFLPRGAPVIWPRLDLFGLTAHRSERPVELEGESFARARAMSSEVK